MTGGLQGLGEKAPPSDSNMTSNSLLGVWQIQKEREWRITNGPLQLGGKCHGVLA